jgi:hypothetical protein
MAIGTVQAFVFFVGEEPLVLGAGPSRWERNLALLVAGQTGVKGRCSWFSLLVRGMAIPALHVGLKMRSVLERSLALDV